MYDTYMSAPGNTAKLGTAHSNIQTAQRGPSLVGSEPTMHYTESALYPLCQPGTHHDEDVGGVEADGGEEVGQGEELEDRVLEDAPVGEAVDGVQGVLGAGHTTQHLGGGGGIRGGVLRIRNSESNTQRSVLIASNYNQQLD